MNSFYNACAVYIGKSTYVWGGQGEDICQMTVKDKYDPEGWIRSKETSASNANRAIATFRNRLAAGCNPVWAVDCSGYVCKVLEALGIIKQGADYNTKGLYAKCDSHPTREELRRGDLVFYSKTGKPADISHVGFYMGEDLISESRGRDYGVVVTEFADKPANWVSEWNLFGRIDKMEPYTEDIPDPTPDYPAEPIQLDVTKPLMESDAIAALQCALNLLGYKDADGNALAEDRKYGNRTKQALDRLIELHRTPKEYSMTVSDDTGHVIYEYNIHV